MRNIARAAFAAALVLAPAAVQAQTCIGVPIGAGQFAIGADVGFPEGGKTYGGVVTANLNGPLSLQARVDVFKVDDAPEDADDSITAFGGQVAYKLVQSSSYSACPFVGVSYFSEGEDGASISALQVPIGLGIGAALPVGGLDLSGFATPQLLITRADIELGPISEDDTSTDFGAEIGARLRTGPVYFGGSVLVTSADDSDPEFRVSVGLALGGSR